MIKGTHKTASMNKRTMSKRHHFVPQMLLRRFVDHNSNLYYFDKRFPSRGVLVSTSQNLFLENHLYTAEDKDGVKDVELESYFSELEGRADHIIEKIVTAARKEQKPNLTSYEKEIWNLFFYYQWKRVPDYFRKIHALMDFDRSLHEAVTTFETEHRPFTDDERRNLQDPAWRDRIKQGAIVQALADPGPLVETALSQKGLGVVVIQKPNKSFVIGSNPVLRLSLPGRSHLTDPTVEIWLPVAHDILVGPAPLPQQELVVGLREDRHIRYINESILKQSTVIAGRSKELISSLVRYC